MKFVQDAAITGGGVLVHAKESDSRSCCVLSAYFMKRYKILLYSDSNGIYSKHLSS